MTDRKKRLGLSNFDYGIGKVPPQSKDLEESVLGAIMLSKGAIYKVVNYLTPEIFYVDAHQRIFKAILSLYQANMPIDILTVVEKLMAQENLDHVGGAYYVTKLTNNVTSEAHIEEHCRLIFEKFIKRELITVAAESQILGYDDSVDSFAALDRVREKFTSIDILLSKAKVTDNTKIALGIIDKLRTGVEMARRGEVNPNDIYTGLREWDDVNGALFPGLYVVAGRPGMGKGIHLTECVKQMSAKYPVGVVNAEMTDEQLLIRIGCNIEGIDNELWKKDKKLITDQELEQVGVALNAVINLDIHITAEKDIDLISSKIKYWVWECGVKVIFADFLGMLNVSEEKSKYWNERQIVNYILKVLVDLCKTLKVPIILYAQLNRGLLGRASKEPNLGDLKESGSIEELAFQVSFLHRPEYYDPDNLVDEMGESTQGLMYQIIAKHRDGKLKRIKYKAFLESSRILPWYNPLPSINSLKNFSQQHNNQITDSVLPPSDRGDFDEGVAWEIV